MTDPIRPEDGQPADAAVPAPEAAVPDAPTEAFTPPVDAAPAVVVPPAAPDVPASDAPVDDPELAAIVSADTAEDAELPAAVAAADTSVAAEPVVAPEPAAVVPPAPVVASVVAPPAAPPVAPPMVAAAAVRTVVEQPVVVAAPRRSGLSTFRRLVAFLFGILQALLILRIVLLLLNADPENQIVNAILSITQPFVDPFVGMFKLDSVTGGNGSVLDIAAIVALVAWTLIETLIVSLLRIFDRRAR